MKKVLFCILVLIFTLPWAQAEVVKVCDTTVSFEGRTSQFIMTVNKNTDNRLSGNVEVTDGGNFVYEKVERTTYSVKEGLSSEIIESDEFDRLNEGERFIIHALSMEPYMSSGVKLKAVRSITLYKFIDENVNIGMTAFAEANDQDGNVMGSFMGGFLVSPCK